MISKTDSLDLREASILQERTSLALINVIFPNFSFFYVAHTFPLPIPFLERRLSHLHVDIVDPLPHHKDSLTFAQ